MREYKFLKYLMVLLLLQFFSSCEGEKEVSQELDQETEKKLVQGKEVPIMGWSSWNHFRTNISDTMIKQQADVMTSSGMKEVGYQYVNIDDGYFGGRNEDGTLISDSLKFPDGMKAVADYIHSKGLKAGIYTDAGDNTCGSRFDDDENGIGVGLYGHDKEDLDLFLNEWGYDFIKVDYCGGVWMGLPEEERYTKIGRTIDSIENEINKDVVYNICRWEFPGTWALPVAESWRISADIRPNFESILHIVDTSAYLSQYASPGHFNDMDMLQVGQGMSYEEDKAHFSMWSIMTSPLLAGNDLREMSEETLEILTNEEVIAINQDPAAIQAKKVKDYGDLEVWVKPLGNRQSAVKAVALLNRSDSLIKGEVTWEDLNIKGKATVRDLWEHEDKGEFESAYQISVPAHGVVMLKVVGNEAIPQSEFEAEYAFMNLFSEEDRATYTYLDNASGGVAAINIGDHPENWIEFREIFIEDAGEYDLQLSYLSANPRDLFITVNEGEELELKDLSSGGESNVETVTETISLKKGYNVVRLHNSSSKAPEIDRIVLSRTGNTSENQDI